MPKYINKKESKLKKEGQEKVNERIINIYTKSPDSEKAANINPPNGNVPSTDKSGKSRIL